MDAQIEALSSHNRPPTDEVEEELRTRLQKQLAELQDLDSEIFALETRLKELNTRRDVKLSAVHRIKSLLSPLRRLSPEILGEIFVRCLPTHRSPIIKATETPLLLTQVCSFWRAAAISEHRLWAQIRITFLDKTVGSRYKDLNRTEMLQKRLDGIKEWLSRSGTRLLVISVEFTSFRENETCQGIEDKSNPISLEFFEFLARLAPRFADLELGMSLSL